MINRNRALFLWRVLGSMPSNWINWICQNLCEIFKTIPEYNNPFPTQLNYQPFHSENYGNKREYLLNLLKDFCCATQNMCEILEGQFAFLFNCLCLLKRSKNIKHFIFDWKLKNKGLVFLLIMSFPKSVSINWGLMVNDVNTEATWQILLYSIWFQYNPHHIYSLNLVSSTLYL
jgi:hypothetical protein